MLFRSLSSVMPSGLAAGLVLLTTALLIIAPGAWLVSVIVVEAPSALTSLRESGLLGAIGSLRVGPIDVGASVESMGGTVVSWLAGQTAALVGGAASTVLDVVIAFFGLFYMLVSGDRAWAGATTSGLAKPSYQEGPRELKGATVSSVRVSVWAVLLAPTLRAEGALPGEVMPP